MTANEARNSNLCFKKRAVKGSTDSRPALSVCDGETKLVGAPGGTRRVPGGCRRHVRWIIPFL